jgi:hypothetical protein
MNNIRRKNKNFLNFIPVGRPGFLLHAWKATNYEKLKMKSLLFQQKMSTRNFQQFTGKIDIFAPDSCLLMSDKISF